MSAAGPSLVESRDTARLEAFSDGVIAIAITLLILHIAVPHVAAGERLTDALVELWPSFLAYLVSFTTILIMWLHHHTLFRIIVRTDHRLLALNGLLLMLITFVNFPTAVLAEYIQGPQRQTATLLYTGTFVLVAVVYNLLWWYACHDYRLLSPSADPAYVQYVTRSYRLGIPAYSAAFVAAFVDAWVSLAIAAALTFFYAFTGVLRGPSPSDVTHGLGNRTGRM